MEKLESNPEYRNMDRQIKELEEKLFNVATSEVKNLYLKIDDLCQKQKLLAFDLLKNY
jgi:hypothetical protein